MHKTRLVPFFSMLFIYLLTMGLYYHQTHSIILEETEQNIKDILLTQRALSNLVSEVQKPEVIRLQNEGLLSHDYFSSALLSSSYITRELNEYANRERKKIGLDPLQYKYASPNPINPDNLANMHELSIYEKFKNKQIESYKNTITENGEEYFYYAIAGNIMQKKCLHCHGDPKDAPIELIKTYGAESGFGYIEGELSSIISIKAPLKGIYESSDTRFYIVSGIIFILFIAFYLLAEIIRNNLEAKDKEIQIAQMVQKKNEAKTTLLKHTLKNLYGHVISLHFDRKGIITDVSDALCQLSGYTKQELVGEEFTFFKHPQMNTQTLKDLWKTLIAGETWKGEMQNLTKDAEEFWVESTISPIKDEHNVIYGFETIMRVITEKKALLADINIDPLTTLLNRRSFEETYYQEKDRAKRDKKYFALFMFDIDFFKQFNDTYGHQKGDEVLQSVANVLLASFRRSSDSVFRLGGEEFAVLASDVSVEKLLNSADNVAFNLAKERIKHDTSKIGAYLTLSTGIVIISPEHTLTLSEAYKQSDAALYRAKAEGRDRIIHTVV